MLQNRNMTINTRIQFIQRDVKLTGISKLHHLKNRRIGTIDLTHTSISPCGAESWHAYVASYDQFFVDPYPSSSFP